MVLLNCLSILRIDNFLSGQKRKHKETKTKEEEKREGETEKRK
jgi:hypothetical protein